MATTVQGELFPRPEPKDMVEAIMRRLGGKDMIPVSEVAAAVGVSVGTVYTWIESGAIQALNASETERPCWKVYRASVIEYIKRKVSGQ